MGRSFGLAHTRSRIKLRKKERGPPRGLSTSVSLSFADLPKASLLTPHAPVPAPPQQYPELEAFSGRLLPRGRARVAKFSHKWVSMRGRRCGVRGPFLALPRAGATTRYLGSVANLPARLRMVVDPPCHSLGPHVPWKYRRRHQRFWPVFRPAVHPRIGPLVRVPTFLFSWLYIHPAMSPVMPGSSAVRGLRYATVCPLLAAPAQPIVRGHPRLTWPALTKPCSDSRISVRGTLCLRGG